MGPNLQDHVSLVFFLAFLLFSWTTASIMSGALIERVRLSAFLLLAVVLGSVRLDHGRRLGLELRRLADDALRLPRRDRVARRARRRGRVHARRPAQPRARGSASTTSWAEPGRFRPHNTHMTLMGLMLIFTGFYGFYAACLVIQSTAFPGWLSIYLSPTTLGTIAMVITFGFAGGFTGGWFASKGDPFWTLSGGLAGRDLRLRRRGRLPPVARLPALVHGRHGVASGSGTGSRRSCASTMPSARSRCTASAASTASSSSGSSRAATRPGSTTSRARSAAS